MKEIEQPDLIEWADRPEGVEIIAVKVRGMNIADFDKVTADRVELTTRMVKNDLQAMVKEGDWLEQTLRNFDYYVRSSATCNTAYYRWKLPYDCPVDPVDVNQLFKDICFGWLTIEEHDVQDDHNRQRREKTKERMPLTDAIYYKPKIKTILPVNSIGVYGEVML